MKKTVLCICIVLLMVIVLALCLNKCSKAYAQLEEAESFALKLAEEQYNEEFTVLSSDIGNNPIGQYALIKLISDSGKIRLDYQILLEDFTVLSELSRGLSINDR